MMNKYEKFTRKAERLRTFAAESKLIELNPVTYYKASQIVRWLNDNNIEFDLPLYKRMYRYAAGSEPLSSSAQRFLDSVAPNQISSKLWIKNALESLDLPLVNQRIEIVGSWYGYPLIDILDRFVDIERLDCWDIDFSARCIHGQYRMMFNNQTADRTDVSSKDYFEHVRKGSDATMLINTSSEHMKKTFADMRQSSGKQYYRHNPLVIIQSNDMFDLPEHVNCVRSTQELIEKHKFRQVLYRGYQQMLTWDDKMEIVEGPYKRYMVIGRLSRD